LCFKDRVFPLGGKEVRIFSGTYKTNEKVKVSWEQKPSTPYLIKGKPKKSDPEQWIQKCEGGGELMARQSEQQSGVC